MIHLKFLFVLTFCLLGTHLLVAQNLTVEGNVGIGTDNPAKRLTVVGDVQLSNSMNASTNAVINAFDGGGGTTSLLDFNVHPNGDNTAHIRLFRTTNVSTAPVIFNVLKGNNSTATNAQIAGNNAHTYFAKDFGNVGIGTGTPTSILHIVGDKPTLKVLDPALAVGEKSALRVGKNTADNEVLNIEFKYLEPRSVASLHMWGDGFGDALTIQKGGHIGIGTDNPVQALDIDGNIILAKATYPSFIHAGGDLVTSSDGDIGLVADANDTNGSAPGNIYFGSGSMLNVDANPDFSFDQAFGQPIHPRNLHMMIEGSTGFVGIGTNDPIRTLHVEGNGYFNGTTTGLFARSNSRSTTTNAANAVEARASFDDNQAIKTGVYARVENEGLIHYGVRGIALGDAINYGVRGQASSSSNSTQYGVYGSGSGGGTEYAGYFAGNLRYTGTLTGPSDEKLKENVRQISNASSLLEQLNPVNFQFRAKQFSSMNLPASKQFGFIAQEVEQVIPELVETDIHPEYIPLDSTDQIKASPAVEFKTVNYIGLIPLLTKAIQEQQNEIETLQITNIELQTTNDELQTKVNNLENRLTQIEALLQNSTVDYRPSTYTTILTDAKLEQNQPNPFTENTLIRYYIPEGIKSAVLRITNVEGKVLKDIAIVDRGIGQTRLEAQSLSAGTYFYTLILDGKPLKTKQMVLTRN